MSTTPPGFEAAHPDRETESRPGVVAQLAALTAAANGILITDQRGRIEWVNPAFTEMSGYSAEEAIGQSPRILRAGAHERAFYEDLWATIAAGRVWRGEMINRRKDGSTYREEMSITPVRGVSGEIDIRSEEHTS